MAELSAKTLERLPRSVGRPAYDRREVTAGIVHLGIGAFHRAHQAAYTDQVLHRDPSWGIIGVSLRSRTTHDALKPQDCLYTLAARDGGGERLRIIGGVLDVMLASTQRARLLSVMADPKTRIVSLTVTEKGYCHDPATGALNEAHPDVLHDLAQPYAPKTAPGLIVEALARRRMVGARPFTVLTCDNLPANGRVVKRIIDRFAALRSPDLGAYVAGELVCPATMVDRITPATTDEDRASIARALGVIDAAPVVTESFSQWVIEDKFALGRPDWEEAGAELVAEVEPFEQMKLRLLNGAHSSLAYLGFLAGYQTVAEVMGNMDFERFVRGLMEQATPTLVIPPSTDLAGYRVALLERFRNPALKHRTWQIAMDGSQKLPQRLLGTIRDCLRLGLPFDRLALGVAAWMRYVTGIDEEGQPIDVRDPLAERLRKIAGAAGPVAERLARGLLSVDSIFGTDLPRDPRFVEAVTRELRQLFAEGAKSTVARAS